MKSYYHVHELAYQQIKSNGFVGWGNAKNLAELGDEKTIDYLKDIVARFFPVTIGKSALDIGCGTGTTAFILARLGFDVTGIDVSETAIQMGKELASHQGLKIQFNVGDILEMGSPSEKYDLVYDSHCLHCIVFEVDRSKALSGLKASLNEDGLFVLDTMVLPTEGFNPAEAFDPLRFDENYILWHETKPSDDHGVHELNGQYWCAQRRIYPPEVVLDEVKKAGFELISERLDAQPGEPSMLRLVLR